jgi:hypothetical protein
MGDLKVQLNTQYMFEISVRMRLRSLFLNETKAGLDAVEESLLLLRGIDLQSLSFPPACNLTDMIMCKVVRMTKITDSRSDD